MIARPFGVFCGAVGVVLACDGSQPVDEPQALASAGAVTVVAAYAPEPITPDVAALYFTLRNEGLEDDRLLAVEVEVAERATVHRQMTDGMMGRMEPVDSLELPAGQTVALVPGGLHIMLEDVRRAYRVGDSLRVTLTLERAGTLQFAAPVIPYEEIDRHASSHDANH